MKSLGLYNYLLFLFFTTVLFKLFFAHEIPNDMQYFGGGGLLILIRRIENLTVEQITK